MTGWQERRNTPSRCAGVVATACTQGRRTQHGKPDSAVSRILLGTAQPGQTMGVFEDVLRRLCDRLHYLYSDQDRFWFDTKPNLRREMESRKQRTDYQEEVLPLLKARVSRVSGRSHLSAGLHVFAPSGDIPDE